LVLAGLQEKWLPLRAELFPQTVLLDLSHPQLLIGQALKGGRPVSPLWTAPVPARTLRDGIPIVRDALGDFIGDLLLEHSRPYAGLVVALPRMLGHWRVIEWPGGRAANDPVAALRARGADLGWPFGLNDACFDVQPLPGSGSCSLVAGAPRQAVEAWIDVFAIAGGTLWHLFPSQVALAAALGPELEAASPGELVALLQPTTRDCQLVVWRDGIPEYERTLPLALDQLVPVLRQALGFCRSRLGASGVRLILAEPLEGSEAIAQQLALPLEIADRGAYGSLHLQGLGELELVS
jgi:Tfp pilus assembly PilM family ATPase